MSKAKLYHRDFMAKLALCKKCHDLEKDGMGWKEVGDALCILPVTAAQRAQYYKNHSSDPIAPMFAHLTHQQVFDIARVIPIHTDTIDELRARLIADYPSIGQGKENISRSLLIQVMKVSGLQWFEKDGRPVIHWKHYT